MSLVSLFVSAIRPALSFHTVSSIFRCSLTHTHTHTLEKTKKRWQKTNTLRKHGPTFSHAVHSNIHVGQTTEGNASKRTADPGGWLLLSWRSRMWTSSDRHGQQTTREERNPITDVSTIHLPKIWRNGFAQQTTLNKSPEKKKELKAATKFTSAKKPKGKKSERTTVLR